MDNERKNLQDSIASRSRCDGSQTSSQSVSGDYQEIVLNSANKVPKLREPDYAEPQLSLKKVESETKADNNSESRFPLVDVITTPQKIAENSELSRTGVSTSEVFDKAAQSLRKSQYENEEVNSSEKHLHSAKYMYSKPEPKLLSQSLIADQQKIALNAKLTETSYSASEIFNLRTQSRQQSQSETGHGNGSKNQLHSAEVVDSKPQALSPLISETEDEDRLEHDPYSNHNMFTEPETQTVPPSVIPDKNNLPLNSEAYVNDESTSEISDQTAQRLHQVKSETEYQKSFKNQLHLVYSMRSERQRLPQSFSADKQKLAVKTDMTKTGVSTSEIFDHPIQSSRKTQPETKDEKHSKNQLHIRDQILISNQNIIARMRRRYNSRSGEKQNPHAEENTLTSVKGGELPKKSRITITEKKFSEQFNGAFAEDPFSVSNVTASAQKGSTSYFRPQLDSFPIAKPTEANAKNEKPNHNSCANKGYDAWKYFNKPPPSDIQTSLEEPKKRKDSENSYRVKVPNIKTLNDAITFFEMWEMFQSFDASLEGVRRHRILASEHEEVVRRVDKDLQKKCLQFHPDRIRNKGGSEKEIGDAEKLQAALNITRTVLDMMTKEFLEDIHIQYKYEFFSQMKLSDFGTEDNIRERICEVLKKIGLLSEIIQYNIVGQVQKFIKCCQTCLENFINLDVDKYEENRDFAIFHLRKCIEEYLKLDEEFQNVGRECREEGLEYLSALMREMAREKRKDLKFLQQLESNKHSLTATMDIFTAVTEMDDYFVLPFAYYLTIVSIGALILKKKSPPKRKLEFVLKVGNPLITPMSSAVYNVARKHNLKPLLSLIAAYNIIWYVKDKRYVKQNKFGVFERSNIDEEAEIQRFNVHLLEVKDYLAEKYDLNFYNVRSPKLQLMEKLAKFKVEDTSVCRKAKDKISRHMEDFKKEREEQRRELSEMKRANEELHNAMKAKSMRLDKMFEALARRSNCSEEMKDELSSEETGDRSKSCQDNKDS